MSQTPPHAHEPFRLQNGGRRVLVVDHSGGDPLHHEVLFQDRYTAIRDRHVFVGSGIPGSRLLRGFGVALLIIAALGLRAAWMQLVQGGVYGIRADENRFRREILPARRGMIRDRNGVVLGENVPSFHVSMRWDELPPDRDERTQTIASVARAIGITSEDISMTMNATGTHPDDWITVARDVPYDRAVALSVELPRLSGVSLVTAAKRFYSESTQTASLSAILGYVGAISPEEYASRADEGYRRNDEIGKTGVELSYEQILRGTPGERRTEVDAFGRPRAVVGDSPPSDGKDVTLTLDLALQQATEHALRRGLERAKVTRGSAILMDVRDGAILAVASLPTFDNNVFAGTVSSTAYQALLNNPDHPLFPRAWAGQFPSGSTIKPLIATAALAEGVITPRTTVLSVGGIRVGPWFFPDWKPGGHGSVSVRSAIAWSVNTFFYQIGGGYGDFIGLGVDRLTKWMHAFGLGSPTGLDVPGETSGNVPSQEAKQQATGERWYIGDTYNLSIGQGDLLVTPMQMARLTATVANGGTLVIPHVATGAVTSSAQLDVDPSLLETIRAGMRDTVIYGSGRALSVLPVPAAGKTGTAQWRSDKPTHAWFIGYAPADHPEVAVTVLLEEGGEGSSFAVPIAGDILRSWWANRQGMDLPAAPASSSTSP